MKLRLIGHDDRYAMEQLQLCLFPQWPVEWTQSPFDGDGAVSSLHRGRKWLTATAVLRLNGRTARATKRLPLEKETYPLRRRILQQSYYLAAMAFLDAPPPWGALSGVRPTKLTTRHLLNGGSRQSADRLLADTFFVTPARRQLCLDASDAAVQAKSLLSEKDISLYIGIPFCPSRCAYCSFVSQTTGSSGALVEPYLEKLIRELALTGELTRRSGCRVRTVYMGGGTPTTLSAGQMTRLMQAVAASFDLSGLLEYTVEGGRPDTLDTEKLRAIRAQGCGRMSINPQTMNDAVLRAVGRPHTAAQTVAAYHQAVQAGFASINMDLIAGLPGDTPASFADSLEQVLALGPSNVTVHTLALKKGAELFEKRGGLPSQQAVSQMVDGAAQRLRAAGYSPYYLYRQKYMSGSFENVGWCRNRDVCLYNIYMMEELQTIVSVGGGGMSKVMVSPTRLERFHNPKFPGDYLRQFDGVLEKKRALFALVDALAQKGEPHASGTQ